MMSNNYVYTRAKGTVYCKILLLLVWYNVFGFTVRSSKEVAICITAGICHPTKASFTFRSAVATVIG